MRKVLAIAFAVLLTCGHARAESIQIFGAGASGFPGACAATSNGQLIFNSSGNCGGITGWTTNGTTTLTGAVSSTITISGANILGTEVLAVGGPAIISGASAINPSLAINGAAIGTNALAVTGTTLLGSQLTLGSGPSILTSPTAASLQLGAADAASPVAQTLRVQSVVAGTANTAGVDWTRQASLGTGQAAGGNLINKTGFSAKSGGTAQGTAVDRNIIIAKGKILTSTNGVLLADIALPSLASAGGVIDATIVAANATDAQSFGQTITYSAVNKLGTIISSITASTGDKSVSTGTLTTLWGLISGANKITLVMTPTSSIAPTANSFLLYFQIRNNSEQATTIL